MYGRRAKGLGLAAGTHAARRASRFAPGARIRGGKAFEKLRDRVRRWSRLGVQRGSLGRNDGPQSIGSGAATFLTDSDMLLAVVWTAIHLVEGFRDQLGSSPVPSRGSLGTPQFQRKIMLTAPMPGASSPVHGVQVRDVFAACPVRDTKRECSLACRP